MSSLSFQYGVKYKRKFVNKKQFYMRCLHYGTKSKVSTGCTARIYAKKASKKEDDPTVKIRQIHVKHKGHFAYSKMDLEKMGDFSDIPEDMKEKALDYFFKGYNPSEIYPKLQIDLPTMK